MTDLLTILPDTACKDAHPQDTVRRIKEILRQQNITTQEHWNDSGVPHCLSVRISIAGTPFGANGKGVTRELALASGYGELMERLQLGYLVKTAGQKAAIQEDAAEDPRMPLDALLSSGIFEKYAELAKKSTQTPITADGLLRQYADAQGNIPVTGFYSIAQGKQVYLPSALRRSVYTTNGCAAGNTMEEAMVQAISEILERHYKSRILTENIPLPDIDEQTLQSCPLAWEIICFLREKDFLVRVKDCSLGGKFPVVCVCLTDRRTGKYHTHFGAFPIFEIALQRTLTESFQGRNLESIGRYADFCDDSRALPVLMSELVRGTAEKPVEFFLNTLGAHTPTAGFSGGGNKGLLKECLAFFQEKGLDVWVRDCSSLGFPTCQVIIPGLSEIFPHRLSPRHNDTRYAPMARKVLRNPANARLDECMGLLMHLGQSQAAGLGGGSFPAEANLAVELPAQEDSFLLYTALAHVHYALGKTPDAQKAIEKAIPLGSSRDGQYLLCLKRYLDLKRDGRPPEEIETLLRYFHHPHTAAQLYALLDGGKNPLDPVVLHCDETCSPDCRLAGVCSQKQAVALANYIHNQSLRLDQSQLSRLLDTL